MKAASLAALEIEHYPGMAEEEIARVVEKAQERWPLKGVTVVHRHGRIAAGRGDRARRHRSRRIDVRPSRRPNS